MKLLVFKNGTERRQPILFRESQVLLMLTHDQVWAAIDALARQRGLTVSGLARKGGLDPTTFNRSKRIGSDGRQRWPSTESLAKVLEATHASLDDFLALLRDPSAGQPRTDGLSEPSGGGYLSASLRLVSPDWMQTEFPGSVPGGSNIVEVVSDTLLPLYREGAFLVTARGRPLLPGDRIVACLRDGSLIAGEFIARKRRTLELRSWTT